MWVSRREIGKKLTRDLTKFNSLAKFPRPYRSMLEDPSMRKPKSKATAQPEDVNNRKICGLTDRYKELPIKKAFRKSIFNICVIKGERYEVK